MAEIIGLIASGISIAQLAGQVTSSTLKLKAYWSQIQEAPADIKILVREIECLSGILGRIGEEFDTEIGDGGIEDAGLRISLELCTEGAEELRGLVVEMEGKLGVARDVNGEGKARWKRKVGAARVVLKKDEIKRLKQRLKSAVRLLGLAHQSYIGDLELIYDRTMVRMQPEIIVARISSMTPFTQIATQTTNVLETTPKFRQQNSGQSNSSFIASGQYGYLTCSRPWMQLLIGSIEYRKNMRRKRGKEKEEINLKLRWPTWLSCQAWEIEGYQDQSAWRFSLRSYRTLNSKHPIFESVKNGDVERVKRQLCAREGFATDRNETGETLLHVAARFGHVEVCQLLIATGADVLATDWEKKTPFETAMYNSGLIFFYKKKEIQGLLQSLVDAGGSELLIQDYRILGQYFGSTESLSYLVRESLPAYQNLSSYDLHYVATCVGNSYWPNGLELVQLILSSTRLDEVLRTRRGSEDSSLVHFYAGHCIPFSLLHVCAGHCSHRLAQPTITTSEDPWRVFTRELILAGADTSPIDIHGMSPLSLLLHRNRQGATLSQLLRDWLCDMKEAGVDLRHYGEIESAIYLSLECFCDAETDFPQAGRHVISFSYGPDVDDWQFWVDEPTDVFAGTFWKMMEAQTTDIWEESSNMTSSGLRIPGSWMEYEDEGENDHSDCSASPKRPR
ncbi:hypothetical protein N431DRAFT_325529 [Stipitochalara longipes BDJ]|nr:hypothetical protein N431DRAFT_325529 [Stipitochalara longipes BDJ]